MYVEPKQSRAVESEAKFLAAFEALLLEGSYHSVTVDAVARRAGKSKGAFITRFGTKRKALDRLFQEFCTAVYDTLDQAAATYDPSLGDVEATLLNLSRSYEELVMAHWGVNRAMNEVFLLEGKIDQQTKNIFKATADLFLLLFSSPTEPPSRGQVLAAVQLLVTLNYNYCLGAMPGLPATSAERHRIISRSIYATLSS